MSAFSGVGGRGSGSRQGSSSSSEQNEEDSTNPALNFFRRVKDAVTRPVPGLVKVTNSAPSSSSATRTAAAGGAQKSTGEGASKQAAAPQGGLKKAAAIATSKPGASKTAAASAASAASAAASAAAQRKPYRIGQFDQILDSENIDLTQLRKLSWNGVPAELRPTVWQMMLGYVPTNKARREVALELSLIHISEPTRPY